MRTESKLLAIAASAVVLVGAVALGASGETSSNEKAAAPVAAAPATPPTSTSAPAPTKTSKAPKSTGASGSKRTAAAALTSFSAVAGDTIKSGGTSVRVLDVDTPERGECGYYEATAITEKFMANGARLTNLDGTDKYGRVLASVENGAGADLGALLIRSGGRTAATTAGTDTDGIPTKTATTNSTSAPHTHVAPQQIEENRKPSPLKAVAATAIRAVRVRSRIGLRRALPGPLRYARVIRATGLIWIETETVSDANRRLPNIARFSETMTR